MTKCDLCGTKVPGPKMNKFHRRELMFQKRDIDGRKKWRWIIDDYEKLDKVKNRKIRLCEECSPKK